MPRVPNHCNNPSDFLHCIPNLTFGASRSWSPPAHTPWTLLTLTLTLTRTRTLNFTLTLAPMPMPMSKPTLNPRPRWGVTMPCGQSRACS